MEKSKLQSVLRHPPTHQYMSYDDREADEAVPPYLCKDAALKGTEMVELLQLLMDILLISL